MPTADCGEKKISLFIRAAKFPSHIEASHLARGKYAPRRLRGEQSGDRQRREKGPPILTAEKGEHRSAHERMK